LIKARAGRPQKMLVTTVASAVSAAARRDAAAASPLRDMLHPASEPEGLYDSPRSLNPDRGKQNRHIQPGGCKCCQAFTTATDRPNQTNSVQESIAECVRATALFGFLCLGDKATDPEQMLEIG
jgi:hypothetical protein